MKICDLASWTSPSGYTDGRTADRIVVHILNLIPNTNVDVLPCVKTCSAGVFLTTPLTRSLSGRIIHQHRWSHIAAQHSVFSASMFLFCRPAGLQKQKHRHHKGEMFSKEVQCLVHNLTCLLANSQVSDDEVTCWLVDVIVELVMFLWQEIVCFSRHLCQSWCLEV